MLQLLFRLDRRQYRVFDEAEISPSRNYAGHWEVRNRMIIVNHPRSIGHSNGTENI